MADRVILVGMRAPYTGDPQGADLWGCNQAYLLQPNLARLYAMDPLTMPDGSERFPRFAEGVNMLGIPVVLQREHPDIEKSEAYPLEEIVRRWFRGDVGLAYLQGGTVAYMIADALLKGYRHIVLYRILASAGAEDYLVFKACLDFWCGIALGMGVAVQTSTDSLLMQPYPWQNRLYGYEPEHPTAGKMLGDTIRQIMEAPRV